MSDLENTEHQEIKFFESLRHGTPYMRQHLKNHEPQDRELRSHKVANAVASTIFLTGSAIGLQNSVTTAVEKSIEAWQDPHFDIGRGAELTGLGMLSGISLVGLGGGLLLAANAQAAYRRQQEVEIENHADQAAS